jgi:hypothetical protein
MQAHQIVRCPNCGNFAERRSLLDIQSSKSYCILQTECSGCDYLMVMSLPTGKVIEAYAPGQTSYNISISSLQSLLISPNK